MNRLGPVARAVLTFAVLGLVALVLVGITGTLVLARLATDQALSQARDFTAFSARVVERRLNDGLLTGDAEASAAIASVLFDAVLHPRSSASRSGRPAARSSTPTRAA